MRPAALVLAAVALCPQLAAAFALDTFGNTSDALAALREADTHLLAQLATAEDPRAAVAVTWVVLNRAGCRVAPLRCRVPLLQEVTRPRAFGTFLRGRWSPAWWPDGEVAPHVAMQVRAVLLGAFPDPTEGALCFHRVGTWVPPWAPPVREWRLFGAHAFYRSRRAK